VTADFSIEDFRLQIFQLHTEASKREIFNLKSAIPA